LQLKEVTRQLLFILRYSSEETKEQQWAVPTTLVTAVRTITASVTNPTFVNARTRWYTLELVYCTVLVCEQRIVSCWNVTTIHLYSTSLLIDV